MTEINDEMILAKAQEISKERGIGLVDAMIEAEEELRPRPELQTSFMVPIEVKPRVARWIVETFGGHAKYTVEERIGAYLSVLLGRTRVSARRADEPAPEVQKGEAVTMRRDQFKGKYE